MRRHDACKRPFDRLRANGIARRACDGVWGRGCNDGQGAPPGGRAPFDFPQGERTPPHLCIHVCAGMARARGPSTGSGRTELRGAPTTGSGVVGDATGLVVGAPRPSPLWIPAFAGTTMGMCGPISAAGGVGVRVPLRRDGRFARRACDGVGVGDAAGVGGGGAPPLAPLDTGFRRYDDGDVRAVECCWWRRGESPAAAGRALREAPLRRVGGVGDATGVGGGRPFDRLRANGIAVRACYGVGVRVAVSACDGVWR